MTTRPTPTTAVARKFLGKFRGTVINNIDPEQVGRIIATVPDAAGLVPLTFALPCLPGSALVSGQFEVPPIGANVWIEFEHGNIDLPIWTGGFFPNAGSIPAAPSPQQVSLKTAGGNAIHLSDDAPTPTAGGVVLKSVTGGSIVVNATGIHISNGQGASITLIGPAVDVNVGALTVI